MRELDMIDDNTVTAELSFIEDGGEPPSIMIPNDGNDVVYRGAFVNVPVKISDASSRANTFTLDKEGFIFRESATAVHDFENEDVIKKIIILKSSV